MNSTTKRGLPRAMPRGFTFIEILVVIAILAVLTAIVILILNPAEYLRRARDAQRLSDATHINQAMALYNYTAAVNNKNQDGDGPRFPVAGSPPTTDSCKNDPIPHRIFVSVPNDNGEPLPTPPTDWTYTQVSSTQLRAVNGQGWLPVDFTQLNVTQSPLSVLPVDPVNTFASGYYYSYGCGSWNLDMRFESIKYQDLATTDGGQFTGVYEIGSDLSVLPAQAAYSPTSTVVSPTPTIAPGYLTLIPYASTTLHIGWLDFGAVGAATVNDVSNNSTYIQSNINNASSTYILNGTVPAFNAVDDVKIIITAKDDGGTATITPIISLNGVNYTAIMTVNSSVWGQQTFTFTNSTLLSSLTPATASNLLAGVILTAKPIVGNAYVSDISVRIDYH